jgi:prepilin-type N-terminal cleavage/methylation domain-containing protein
MQHKRSRMRRRLKRQKHGEGMTLIEIMIVVVIMAMIAAAAGFGVMNAKKGMDKDMAKSGVHRLASVAESYILQNRGGCPSLEDLKSGDYLSRGGSTEDPWGEQYALVCEEGGVAVRSSGPDKQMMTDDDIAL